MPAIANLSVAGDNTLPATVTPTNVLTFTPDFARKDEAVWRGPAEGGIDASRPVLRYTRRGPVKGQSDLIKHTFRLTYPTMKSIVAEGVPYEPPPVVDFVDVVEVSVWAHPRTTATARESVLSMLLTQTATMRALFDATLVDGESIY
jgi:hypothetical protein